MYLAERIVITKDVHRQFYELADRNARLAKQLYNAALFRLRQTFTGWEKDVRTENEKEVFRELDLLKERYPKLKAGRVLSYGVLEKLMRVERAGSCEVGSHGLQELACGRKGIPEGSVCFPGQAPDARILQK